MLSIQKTKKPLRKPTTKQKAGKVKGRAKHAPKAPRKALGALQSPSNPLPTPQAKATPTGKLEPLCEEPKDKATVKSSQPLMKALGILANPSKTAEPPKSELELLIEAVNHKHMDTLRLGKAFVASAIETGLVVVKAAKRASSVGLDLSHKTSVSDREANVYSSVAAFYQGRIASLVSPTSRANLVEVLQAMEDLGLQIGSGE